MKIAYSLTQVWNFTVTKKTLSLQISEHKACIDVKNTFAALDAYQRAKLIDICTTNPQTTACANEIGKAQSGDWAVITESDNYPGIDPSKPGKEALHLICGSNQICRDEITRQDLRNNLDQLIVERDPAFLKRTADGYRNGVLGKVLDFRGMNDKEVIDHAKAAMYASVGMIGSIGKSKVGNQWKAKDSATTRKFSGPVFKTDTEAAKAAKSLGYIKTNFRTKSGAVIFKKDNSYITRDVDGHIGGAWKEASSPEKLNSKNTRNGTFDLNLKKIGD
ncbi:toxin C-terminal domain-containing protein [Uruburuella testudinis]|uniref:Toxin C-terminal domain-containing protein n=1 Tax=Uruburuella testudinis TaxID=1282863 RepID=A0ABY4DPG5_9NEIS|nr:toxin C-terminal domain-containing protein [Uruburuella testudinis]UOO80756.1 toxin C-terminal domain-containing protein [Uruburuella testudinis]